MRANRLVRLLLALQLHGKTTASALAKQCEVSLRTIYRDLEALEEAGIPLITDRGRDGGVQLLSGYQTRLTGLTQAEAESLPLIQFQAAAAALGRSANADGARLKLLAALPLPIREHAFQASQRFHVDPAAWYQRHVQPPLLHLIAEAVWTGHLLEMDYESWKSRKASEVEPLGLVLKSGSWYLLAKSRRGKNDIYRVQSVHNARILSRKTSFPKDFNLAAVWETEVSRFEASLRKQLVTVRVARDAMSRIYEMGAHAADSIRDVAPDEGGCRQATIWIESIPRAVSQLLGFGTNIEVIEPIELRTELKKAASAIAKQYRR